MTRLMPPYSLAMFGSPTIHVEYDMKQGLASLAVSIIRIGAGSLGVVFIHKEDSRVLCHDSGTRAMVMHFRVVLMDEPTAQRPCSNRDCRRKGGTSQGE